MMDNVEKEVIKKEEKVKKWIKNPYNLAFILMLLLTIGLRLYYFDLTKNQPVWWDESDYLAYAKNIAGLPVTWTVSSQHNSLFPFILAGFFKLGLGEATIKFLIELIPSILIILLSFSILSLIYKDKRVALIGTFLMGVFWEMLFNSMRFHLEGPALVLGLLATYVFWKGYEKKEKFFGVNAKWAMVVTVIIVMLTYGMRRGFFAFAFFFLIYMLMTKKFSVIIKDKYNWIALAIGVGILFVLEGIIFGAPITKVIGKYSGGSSIWFSMLPLGVFKDFFENLNKPLLSILLYLFWIGLAFMIVRLAMYIGNFKKTDNADVKGDLFFVITIIVTLAYFIFYQKPTDNYGEGRWYFPLLLGCLVAISRSSLKITDYIKRYNRYIAVAILIVLIGYGGYNQVMHADSIINNKVSSFQGVKDAGLYIKSVSNLNDVVIGYPTPQLAYYTERKVVDPEWILNKTFPATTQEEFFAAVDKEKDIKYLAVYLFEPALPQWMLTLDYANNNGQTMIKGWQIPFMDTVVDYTTQQQKVTQSKTYGPLTFKLVQIKDDVLVYEIIRS